MPESASPRHAAGPRHRKWTVAAVVCVAGIVGALTATAVAQSHRFPDVPPDHYAYEAVEWAAEAGVTLGYGDGTFKPERPLGRWHAVVFLERYYDEILQAEQSADFTRADMMVLLKAINDGSTRDGGTSDGGTPSGSDSGDDVGLSPFVVAVRAAASVGDGFSAGGRHTCALGSDGAIECWGDRREGRLNAPAADNSREFVGVAAGAGHSCVIDASGTIECWGDNEYQQASAPAGAFDSVSAGRRHTCAVAVTGHVTCWGDNTYGQALPPQGQFDSVSAGLEHTCGLRADGTVTCWGDDTHGQATAPDGAFVSVSAGGQHSCALRADGAVVCWGRNYFGQADIGAGPFRAVSTGTEHTCGLRTDSTLTCWGNDSSGRTHVPQGFTAGRR